MDGADAASFGEALLFESTRRRYSSALETTENPQERLRIANDRALLARQAFGQFSGEEVERVYAEEMRGRRGRVALGSTDFSERALRVRQIARPPLGDGRNVAVVEYRDAAGSIHYIERTSEAGAHAEARVVLELQRLRIPRERVTRLYTDRQPCSERCTRLLQPYEQARITWAVDWPNDEGGRAIANNALRRQIAAYRHMETQGTLPMLLWRQPNPAGNYVRPSRPRRRP